jgi:hypothetical protein
MKVIPETYPMKVILCVARNIPHEGYYRNIPPSWGMFLTTQRITFMGYVSGITFMGYVSSYTKNNLHEVCFWNNLHGVCF